MRKIENYEVFQDAHKIVLKIYKITNSFPKEEVFGLTSQMRRAAYSIPSNLAEGSIKGEKEFHHFIEISLGSAEELKYFLRLSRDLEYINKNKAENLSSKLIKISKQLNALLTKTSVKS